MTNRMTQFIEIWGCLEIQISEFSWILDTECERDEPHRGLALVRHNLRKGGTIPPWARATLNLCQGGEVLAKITTRKVDRLTE